MAIPILTKIKLDSSELSAGVTRAKTQLGNLKNAATTLGPALAGAFAIGGIRQMAQEADRIGKLANRLNTSAETLQRLGFAADLSGSNLETVANALTRAGRKASDLENSGLQKAFKELNVSQEAFLNADVDGKLQLLADGFVNAESEAAAFQALFTILEDDAKQLIPLLRNGSEGIAELMGEANVLTEEQIAKIEAMNDSMTRFKNLSVPIKGAFMDMLAAISSGVQKLGVVLADFVAKVPARFRRMKAELNPFIDPKDYRRIVKETNDELDRLTAASAEELEAIDIAGQAPDRNKNTPDNSTKPEYQGLEEFAKGVGRDNSAETFFDFAQRQANIAEAERLGQFDRSIDALQAGIAVVRDKQAGTQPFTVIADSLAKIGGGGTAVGVNNPEIKRLDDQISLLKESVHLLEQLRDKKTDLNLR